MAEEQALVQLMDTKHIAGKEDWEMVDIYCPAGNHEVG